MEAGRARLRRRRRPGLSYNGATPKGSRLTVDEELSKLDDNIRRLKIEYEAYFNGGTPRPPNDLAFRVESVIKKHSGGTTEMNFSQRFKFNQLVQRYAVHADLWRKRLKAKEEGLAWFGAVRRSGAEAAPDPTAVRVAWENPDEEKESVQRLFEALVTALDRTGRDHSHIDETRFAEFIRKKTRQAQARLGCKWVQFSVSVEEGYVKLKAGRAKGKPAP